MDKNLDSMVLAEGAEEGPQEGTASVGYLRKPSREGGSNEVNSITRIPRDKRRTHRAQIKAPVGRTEVQYGKHISYVDGNRAREHRAQHTQQKTLEKLFNALRNPNHGSNRQGALMELYEDLQRYPTSIFPNRSLHTNLMSDLQAAVQGNLTVSIGLIHPRYKDGKTVVGYYVKPV